MHLVAYVQLTASPGSSFSVFKKCANVAPLTQTSITKRARCVITQPRAPENVTAKTILPADVAPFVVVLDESYDSQSSYIILGKVASHGRSGMSRTCANRPDMPISQRNHVSLAPPRALDWHPLSFRTYLLILYLIYLSIPLLIWCSSGSQFPVTVVIRITHQ